jgi:hypothetical protein
MQAVEKQVEEHKRQMRRMPSMVDITGLYEEMIFGAYMESGVGWLCHLLPRPPGSLGLFVLTLSDRELDPPFSPSWITKSGVMGYMGSRMKRLIGSKQQ